MGKVARQSILTTISSYLGIGLGMVNKFLLFPNILLANEVGLLNLLVELSVLFTQFSMLGTSGTILKFFPLFENKKKKHHGFVSFTLLVSLVGLILFSIIFLLFKPAILNYFGKNSGLVNEYLPLVLILAGSLIFSKLISLYLRSLYKSFVPVFIQDVVIRLLVTCSISLYALEIISFNSFVYLFVLVNSSGLLFLLIYLIYLKQGFLFVRLGKKVMTYAPKMLWYGFYAFLNEIASMLLTNIDSIMIAGIIGLSGVGIFTTVLYISAVIMIPGRTLISTSAPRVAEFWVSNNIDGLARLYKRVTSINTVISTILFVVLWVNFENLFSFVPPNYASGKMALLFLGLTKLIDSSTGLNTVILVTSRKFRIDFVFNLVLLITAVLLNLWLIPIHGITGAAVATFICYGSVNFLRIAYIWVVFKLNPFSIGWVITLALGGGVSLLSSFIPLIGNHYVDIILRTLMVLTLLVAPLLYFKISPDLNGQVQRILSSLKKKGS